MTFAYFETLRILLDQIEMSQAGVIGRTADVIADSLAAGGVLHIFGTGHGHLLAEELFYRAGGLAPVNAILAPGLMLHDSAQASTLLERTPGYATLVLEQYDLRAGEVLIIASNSGRNVAPVEAALAARQRGLTVVALTSLQHSQAVTSRHDSGLRLFEVADIVIDNCGIEGDAAIEIQGMPGRVGATSTIAGAAILQALAGEIITRLLERGRRPPVLRSANVDGGDELNNEVLASYRRRLRSL